MTHRNKVVVVTGAGEGVGRSIAIAYAAEGARVVVVDINSRLGRETVDCIYDIKGKGIYLKGDVTVESDVISIMKTVIQCYGKIDILVNNVGRYCSKSLIEIDYDEWNQVISANLGSVFLCSREVLKYMKRIGNGVIINIAASKSLMVEPNMEAFVTSKEGVVTLTSCMATSLDESNIRVNSISPGYLSRNGYERLATIDRQAEFAFELERAEYIAKACIYISADGNSVINGSNIIIDKTLIRKLVYID